MTIRRLAAATAVTALGALAAVPGQALAEPAAAIDETNNVYTFDTRTPGVLSAPQAITGLGAGETVVGIDARPATGELFALTRTADATANGRLYVIDPATGAATQVTPDESAFTLTGGSFGFDFNPQIDRIRVVSDDEQNLVLNPNTGLLQLAATALTAGDNPTPNVVAAAYDRNLAGTQATQLYVLDSGNDTLYEQNNNGGVLTDPQDVGADFGPVAGFDISSRSGTAYASVQVTDGTATLHTIDLATGDQTPVGALGAAPTDIADIAVVRSEIAIGLVATDTLVRFAVDTPGEILATIPITGLDAGDEVIGIDVRPSTGELFALTLNGTEGQLYVVDKATGAAVKRTADGDVFTLTGTHFGFDFNPQIDRIRVVSDDEQNLVLNPITGQLQLIATSLTAADNPTPNVVAAAYDRNRPGTPGTQLYVLDSGNDTLYKQDNNGGVLTEPQTVGADFGPQVGFDIGSAATTAYASVQLTPTDATFHTIDLATGDQTTIGVIGAGTGDDVRDVTVDSSPSVAYVSSPTEVTVDEGDPAVFTVTRNGDTSAAATVNLTVSGTASPNDLVLDPVSVVTFAAGESSKTVTVNTVGDGIDEADETVVVTLTGPVGAILGGSTSVTVTIADDDTVTSAPEQAYGIDASGNLVAFMTDTPQTTTVTPITGLGADDVVVGLDVQPATGRLFAVTKDADDDSGDVFVIDPATGAAANFTAANGSDVSAFSITGDSVAVDFNPVPNAIRVVGDDGQNLRIPLATGVVATDTPVNRPDVVGVAYTNPVAGAQQSTLFGVDSGTDSLVRIGGNGGVPSPNGGVATTIAPLGVDVGADLGFDISPGTNVAYIAVQLTAGETTLHRLNLATGAPDAGQQVGGQATDLRAFTVAATAPSVQFAAAATGASEKAGTATVTITRTGDTSGASTVSFATTGTGTATEGEDFTAVPTTAVAFAAGETSKTVTVTLLDDTVIEDAETIGVALTGPMGASLGAPNAATITVFDDDTPGPVTEVPGPTTTVPGPTVTVPGPPTTVPGPTVFVPVPVTPAPGPDTRGPRVTVVTPPEQLARTLRANGVVVRLACDEGCTYRGTITGTGSPRGRVATFTGRISAAGRQSKRVRFSAAARRALARSRTRGSLRVVVTATDAAGNRATGRDTTRIVRR